MLLAAADSISSWNVTFPAGSIGLHLAVFDERVVVQDVAPDSPAARALPPFARGDVVTRVNASPLPTADGLAGATAALASAPPPRTLAVARSDAFARWFRAAQTELPPSLRDGDFAIAQGLVEVARAEGVFDDAAFDDDRACAATAAGASSERRRRARVVVGVSTVPPRLARLLPTLRSLLAQPRVDVVYASVPRAYHRFPSPNATDVPPELVEAARASGGRLRIARPRDVGPATKLLGVLEAEAETPAATRAATLVLLADDDYLYAPYAWATELARAAVCRADRAAAVSAFRFAHEPAGGIGDARGVAAPRGAGGIVVYDVGRVDGERVDVLEAYQGLCAPLAAFDERFAAWIARGAAAWARRGAPTAIVEEPRGGGGGGADADGHVDGSWVLGDDLAISAWLVARNVSLRAARTPLLSRRTATVARGGEAFSEGALKHSADGGRFADDNMRRYVRDLPYVWREAHRVAGHDEDAIPPMPGPFAGWHAR